MVDNRKIKFSATELKAVTGWPDSLVEEFLAIVDDQDINSGSLSAIQQDVANNTAAIAVNASDITDNANDILSNSNAIISNANDISSLETITQTQFQAIKNSTQATTNAFAVVTGFTVDKNVGGFVFDSGLGTLEFASSGEYEVSFKAISSANMELQAQLDPLGGGSFADISGAYDAASGSVSIVFQLSINATDEVRLTVKDDGVSGNINSNRSLIQVRRIS